LTRTDRFGAADGALATYEGCASLNALFSAASSHYIITTTALNASENTRGSRSSSAVEAVEQEGSCPFLSPAHLQHVHPPPPTTAMDPPRTRSRSRSGFYHFGMSGNVGSNGSGNAVGNGGLMTASGGGLSYAQQSNPGWAPHHGGHSYPESQQQQQQQPHTQGSYLSAGAQRHPTHGAHRHPGAGKQASENRACSRTRCITTHAGYTPRGTQADH